MSDFTEDDLQEALCRFSATTMWAVHVQGPDDMHAYGEACAIEHAHRIGGKE